MTEPQDPFAAPPQGATPPPPPGAQPPPYGAPPPAPYGQPAPYGAPAPYGMAPPGGRKNGMGVASLVLGILAMTCLCLLVIPGILAVVFGVQGRGRAKRGEASNGGVALAGIITGGIGLAFAAIFWLVVAANYGDISDYMDCMDAAGGNTAAEEICSDQLADTLFQ